MKPLLIIKLLSEVNWQKVFVATFIYTLVAGLILQLWILPILLPGLHAGDGLMMGTDSVGFHQQAISMAVQIRNEGWGAWGYVVGAPEITLTSAIYAITGINKPFMLLPLNALLFALAAASLFQTLRNITSGVGAVVAILPFVLFPSALQIYGQIHKDVASIAGYALFSLVWVRLSLGYSLRWEEIRKVLAMLTGGIFMVWFARPYLMQITIVAAVVISVLIIIQRICISPQGLDRKGVLRWWLGLTVALMLSVVLSVALIKEDRLWAVVKMSESTPIALAEVPGWRQVGWLPSFLDSKFERISRNRNGYSTNRAAGSNVDGDVTFASASEVFAYVPRAMQIALFAPFPDTWLAKGQSPGAGKMRLIAAVEMMFAYAIFAGIIGLFVLARAKRGAAVVMIILAIVPLVALGLVVCNVGTLYRMRYEYWQSLLGLGMAGWSVLFERWLSETIFGSYILRRFD